MPITPLSIKLTALLKITSNQFFNKQQHKAILLYLQFGRSLDPSSDRSTCGLNSATKGKINL